MMKYENDNFYSYLSQLSSIKKRNAQKDSRSIMVEMQARVSFDAIYAMGEKEELDQCEQEFLVR
jgi:hypothetical protein